MVENPLRRSRISALMRVGVLLALVAALLQPEERSGIDGLNVALVVPPDAADSVLERIRTELGPDTTVSTVAAAGDLEAAFRSTLWQLDREHRNVVVLAGDGYWPAGLDSALRAAGAASLPVYWLPVETAASLPRVSQVLAPGRARAGDRIGITVAVEIDGPAELILRVDGRPLPARNVLRSGPAHFQAVMPAAGPVTIVAAIRPAGQPLADAGQSSAALVNIAGPDAILVVATGWSAFAESLRLGGWAVTVVDPAAMPGISGDLHPYGVLVLDNISAGGLADSSWQDVTQAVRNDGLGLLVLGGPDAFGRGGYRDSALEELLPVISEPPGDDAPASLMFLVDVSGSMAGPGPAAGQLDMARQAVREAASALRPADLVGLMTFDIEAAVRLPLAARQDHLDALAAAWPARASGGTRLLPALRLARDALVATDTEQKLLVLLTDGRLAAEELARIDAELHDTGIELLGMVIESAGQSGIAGLDAGVLSPATRLVPIDDVLRLPALMRREVEASRPAVVVGESLPVAAPGPGLLPETGWPPLAAYSLTRPRPSATVHLRSARGDVLVASRQAGTGRVAVLTPGFSGWTANWLQWRQWPMVATRLIRHVAAGNADAPEIVVHGNAADGESLTVDLLARELPATLPVVRVAHPSGRTDEVPLARLAPGRLGSTLRLEGFGQYSVSVDDGRSVVRQRFIRHEMPVPPGNQAPIAESWLEQGLLSSWSAAHAGALEGERAGRRHALLALAVGLFIVMLVYERQVVGGPWLRRQASRFRADPAGA